MYSDGPMSPTPSAAPPDTLTDFVTEQLRNRIVLGTLPPGRKLPVYELAQELGVSRVPLREAVRQLEAESLVDNLPRRGTVVRPLTEEDLRDSFEILDTIEVIAVRRAAESAPDELVAAMQHWLDVMQRLGKRRVSHVSEEMLHAHRQFHFTLFRGAGDGVLLRHLCMLWNTCERYVVTVQDPKRQAAAAREHAELVAHIEARDAEGTEAALRGHLRASRTAAFEHLAARLLDAAEGP